MTLNLASWSLNTLSYQVEKHLRESIYNSEAYRKHRWNLFESQIIQWSRTPFKSIVRIYCAITLILIAAHLLETVFFPLDSGYLYYNWRWVASWETALLSVQVTIIGVVLPLVVGLVGFLLQEKTASKSIWSLYRQYSGFLFIGYSGLAALVFIIIAPYLETFVSESSYTLCCVLSTAWVVANILLSGWFLKATFMVIHEPSRDALLLRYTINESFTDSIKYRLSTLIPRHLISEKGVFDSANSNIKTSTYRSSLRDDKNLVASFRKERYVVDIRFRILKFALFLFMRQVSRLTDRQELTLPVVIDNVPRKQHEILAYNNIEPHFVVRFLVRLSYKFSKSRPLNEEILDDILFSLIGSAYDDLKDDNTKLFERSVDKMVEWHCAVLEALSFVNDEGDRDNWMLLPSGGWLSRSFLDQVLREYYLLTEKSVSVLADTTSFYQDLIHVQLQVYSGSRGDLPQKVTEELIRSSYLAWVVLVQWSSKLSRPLSSSIFNNYENALMSYVGVWENWPMYLEPKSKRWKENIESVPLYLQHLRCTGQQLITAVRYGDVEAAKWAADMLLNWFSNISLYEHLQGQYFWLHEIVTTNILVDDVSSPIWITILNDNEYDEKSAVQLAMENAWLDLRLICACYLNSIEGNEDNIAPIIDALVSGTRLKPSGSVERGFESISKPPDILGAFIRQCCYWDYGGKSYGSWLDSIVEVFSRIDEPKRVSGRIYSGFGRDDVRSLRYHYAYLMIARSDGLWSLSQRWLDILFSPIFEQKHRDALLDDLQSWVTFARDEIATDTIYTEAKVSNFIASIERLITTITEHDTEELRNAEIDDERLLEFSRAASVSGFDKNKGSTLLALFSTVEPVNQLPENCKKILRISGYSKSNIAKDIEVNRAINEEEWMDDAVSDHISQILFRQLSGLASSTAVDFDSSRTLVDRISADINAWDNDSEDLVVFIGPWEIHRVFTEALYSRDQNSGLNIDRRDGNGNAYICHLDGCPVYQLPHHLDDFAMLLPRRAFDTVAYKKIGENRFVDVSYESLDEQTLKLTLVFKYYMDVRFSDTPIHRYILRTEDDA